MMLLIILLTILFSFLRHSQRNAYDSLAIMIGNCISLKYSFKCDVYQSQRIYWDNFCIMELDMPIVHCSRMDHSYLTFFRVLLLMYTFDIFLFPHFFLFFSILPVHDYHSSGLYDIGSSIIWMIYDIDINYQSRQLFINNGDCRFRNALGEKKFLLPNIFLYSSLTIRFQSSTRRNRRTNPSNIHQQRQASLFR